MEKPSRKLQFRALPSLAAIIAGVAALALLIVLIEIVVRLSTYYVSTQTHTGPLRQSQQNVYRVVTLGESTTAPDRENKIAWPIQLQNILNAHFQSQNLPDRVEVVNLARNASSSVFQVRELYRQTSEVNPDIVITMLGLNDVNVVEIEQSKIYQWSFTYRFLYWAVIAAKCSECQVVAVPEDPSSLADLDAHHAARQLVFSLDMNDHELIQKLEQKVRLLQNQLGDRQHVMNVYLAQLIFNESQNPRHAKLSGDTISQLHSFIDSLFKNSYEAAIVNNSNVLKNYCTFLIMTQRPGCLEAFTKAKTKKTPLSPSLLNTVAKAGGDRDPRVRAIFQDLGFTFADRRNASLALNKSYQRLQEFVRSHDVTWFAMQYPTGSVEALRYFMSDEAASGTLSFEDAFQLEKSPYSPQFTDVIYVSNRNFNEFVQREGAAEYFTDMYAQKDGLRFGHTTKKGYALIANNLAKEVIAHWPAVKARADRRRLKNMPRSSRG